jgi:hypothetical protein
LKSTVHGWKIKDANNLLDGTNVGKATCLYKDPTRQRIKSPGPGSSVSPAEVVYFLISVRSRLRT